MEKMNNISNKEKIKEEIDVNTNLQHAIEGTEKKEGEKKLLSPKIDVIFQILFGEVGSEKITKSFLEAILGKEIKEVDLEGNIVLRRENLEDKMGVLDVLAKINDEEYCNIEMQMVERDKVLERILYYWAKVYTRNIKKGKDYIVLQKTIEVLIINFEIKELKELGYHSKWKIIEEKYRKQILTEDLEIHIIELPKIRELTQQESKEELVKWLNFIEEPESEKVVQYMKENEGIKEAKEKLEVMSEDERIQRLAELREKAIMDEKAIERFGIKKGIEKGIKQTAKKMKEEGLDIELIKRITNLTEEEIKLL